jgi:hypothetical protein
MLELQSAEYILILTGPILVQALMLAARCVCPSNDMCTARALGRQGVLHLLTIQQQQGLTCLSTWLGAGLLKPQGEATGHHPLLPPQALASLRER